MSIFDKFHKSKSKITLEELMNEEYQQLYFDECKYIWKNYVPKSGQSNVLQGELLRQIEKLRGEAQDNGNINWDEDFAYFCDFIKETLCSQDIYKEDEKQKFVLILNYFKECGNYAVRLSSGQIQDNEVEVEKIAYVKDNLYEIIEDAIGQFYAVFTTPIPYEINEKINR